MKEAVGGSYIFQIVIVFIALFSTFIVYSVSYSKAFKVKNEVLDLIEQYQGFTKSSESGNIASLTDEQLHQNGSVEELAYAAIRKAGYKHDILDGRDDLCYMKTESNNTSTLDNIQGEMQLGGYCVYKMCSNNEATRNTTYKVTTFIALEIPVINLIIKVPVSGETKTIYSDVNQMSCSNGTDFIESGE